MTDYMWQQIESLPSTKEFLDSVTADLIDGRSVIVLLPPGPPPPQVVDAIISRLRRADRVVDIANGPFLSAVDIAAQVMRHGRPSHGALQSILREPGFPDVVVLDNVCENHSTAEAAAKLVRRWSDCVKQHTAYFPGPRSLLLVAEAKSMLEYLHGSDVCLSIRWWWGFPSEPELRLLSRTHVDGGSELDLWRECVISAFGCGDAALSVSLLDESLLSLRACTDFLIDYAKRVGIEPRPTSPGWLRPQLGRAPASQPEGARAREWSGGQLICSFEHGVEMHPAAVAMLPEGEEELARRLWRSQVPMLLPVVDRIRATVCQMLDREYGNAWYDRLDCKPNADRDQTRLEADPMDAELGLLFTILKRGVPAPALRRWEKPVEYAYEIRNSLAHYQPVSYARMGRLWSSL